MIGPMAKPSEQLRKIIRTSGMTRYQIAKESKVSEATLSRFMARKSSVTLDVVDALAGVLRVSIVSQQQKEMP
jgi:transcriptional regulator with XRE-family HTH domain